ncbi:hypothetical protein YPPY08_0559, partial [Yersinia pestis PY-08]
MLAGRKPYSVSASSVL